MGSCSSLGSESEVVFILVKVSDELAVDWKRMGTDQVYPFPEDMLRESQARMARHRLLVFNMIRSNPKICGYNLTGMLDHGMTGEGVWRFWRDWKPGAMDAMQDGWWPLRWCLFVTPTHVYAGRPFAVEAVLANEDVLGPGEYPVEFKMFGPAGVAWERKTSVRIAETGKDEDGLLAVPVLSETITLHAPAGPYRLIANLEQGGAPLGRSWGFFVSDAASLPRLNRTVTAWGIGESAERWLKKHGVDCRNFEGAGAASGEVILVGDVSRERDGSGSGPSSVEGRWKELNRRMAEGSTVVFLSPHAFQKGKDPVGWLPLTKKGRCYKYFDWLYHKECVAKKHPVFEGLQSGGILDWYYYGPMIPHYLFDGQDLPDEVIAAAFATGFDAPGGYASGILMGSYRSGRGRFVVNTFPVLENLDHHPAADRLLLNLVNYAAGGS